MAIAEGSTSYFAYKKETVANTQETGAGGAILRRATGSLDLVKAEVTSQEKRTDFQETNVNHGTRSVNWAINGEMFGGDYKELLAALVRRDFAAITQIDASAGDGFVISSGVLTRAAGGAESFITDGLFTGMIIRLSGMAVTGNNSRNLRITSMTATTLTLQAVDGGNAVADDASANEAASILIPGQTSYVPSTGHTSDTLTIEKYESKTTASQIARGCKVGSSEISVQPDQPVTLSFSGLGIDRSDSSGAAILTSPTAAGSGAAMSSGIGFVRVGSNTVAVVTGLTLSLDLGTQNAPVAFANTSPDIFYGRAIQVTGTINVLKEGITLSTLFDNETEVALEFFIEAPGSAPKAFVNLYFGRVKLNSADEDDPDGPVVQTFNFRALKPTTATGVNETVIMIQDSSAS